MDPNEPLLRLRWVDRRADRVAGAGAVDTGVVVRRPVQDLGAVGGKGEALCVSQESFWVVMGDFAGVDIPDGQCARAFGDGRQPLPVGGKDESGDRPVRIGRAEDSRTRIFEPGRPERAAAGDEVPD